MASHAPYGKRSRIPRSNRPKGKPRGKPFAKGTINNPLGRPKLPPGTREAFQEMLPEALGTLQEVFTNPKHPRQEQAAEYVVNQALGTARQSVDLRSPDGSMGGGGYAISVTFQRGSGLDRTKVVRVGPDGQPVDALPPTPPEVEEELARAEPKPTGRAMGRTRKVIR
jgi:hypothetical protein